MITQMIAIIKKFDTVIATVAALAGVAIIIFFLIRMVKDMKSGTSPLKAATDLLIRGIFIGSAQAIFIFGLKAGFDLTTTAEKFWSALW